MFRHADGTNARPAATGGDAKRLVQVQMAYVRPHVRGPANADLRVHVGAIHIDLPAVRVNRLANVLDGFLEHAVRGRIGDHEGGQLRAVRRRLGLEVREIDVAFRVALDGDDLLTGHDRAGRVCAVRGAGDEADVALRFAALLVKFADDEQTGIFTLRAGIGLQRDAGEAGDFRQPFLQLLKQNLVSLGLAQRREGMNLALNSGHDTGNISTVAFNFIVQEPSGIMDVVRDKSRDSNRRR